MWKSSDLRFSQVHMKGTLDSKISYFVRWNPFREKKLDSKNFLTFFSSDSWVQCQDVCTHFYTEEEGITWVLKMRRRQTSWVVIPGSNFKMATPCLGQQNNRLEDQIRKGTVKMGHWTFLVEAKPICNLEKAMCTSHNGVNVVVTLMMFTWKELWQVTCRYVQILSWVWKIYKGR